MRRIELHRDDVTLSGLVGGDPGAPPVLLLHGLAGSAEELRPTAAALLAAFRVVALDQRGHGHSTRRPADLSRRAFVADAAAAVEELCGGGPVAVAGQSMGGHTAMLLAAWYPHLVGGLVMLEAGVGGAEPGDDYPARLGRWFAAWPVPFASRAAAVAHLGATPAAHAWAADLAEGEDGLRPRFDADVMEAAIAPVAAVARWDAWRSITAPTLLVRGERGTCPPAEDERMRELRPEVGYAVIEGAGHDAHLDQPAAWLTLLRGALGSMV
ncbi:alpha/beta fold hydrolase [Dactylosporangium sp. CA-052675]|uniref:alpha/beta fold hydrolase n=1 Tax=Dactylosporangium sp. CA-052675 TaxID=3239927 RepID=UPI003D91CE79